VCVCVCEQNMGAVEQNVCVIDSDICVIYIYIYAEGLIQNEIFL
jgi:hypothetical protein